VAQRTFNVLFLCTGNSARSIMAECAMNRWGLGQFRGYSAGSTPKGQIHPMAVDVLRRLNYRTDNLLSRDWTEFALGAGGPPLDFVFTLCDQAAGEVCPAWPGQPMTAHGGVEDPAASVGPEDKQRRLFRTVYGMLENRIKIFTSLPLSSLDRLTLQSRLQEIGRMREGAEVSEEA
jgi:arsenate reductase